MTEKTEWEVVDEQPRGERPRARDFMKALLGPRWRWKVAGGAIVSGIVLVTVAALTTMFALLLAAGAVVSIAVAKMRRWLRGQERHPAREHPHAGPFHSRLYVVTRPPRDK